MSIQSNINQSISLMGLLISQSEYAKHTQEVSRAKKNVATAGKAAEVAGESISDLPPDASLSTVEMHAGLYDETLGALESAEQRLFSLDPTEKNYKEILKSREGRAEMKSAVSEEISSRKKAAEARAKAADAAEAEAERLRMSRMLDLSKLDERTTARVERAYKRAERDTKYLTKGGAK